MFSLARFSSNCIVKSPSIMRMVSTSTVDLKGHSKWQNIKATKGKNDMIKSKATNFLLKKVRGAVSRGGFDLKLNRELAGLENDFRAQGLPLDTFKNFLQKLKDKPEIEYHFDIIGPAGTFFIVQAETSNKKAFENDLRKYFNKLGGFRLAADGGVRTWFEEKGVICVEPIKDGKTLTTEQMEEVGIENDCEEVSLVEEDGGQKFEFLCEAQKLNSIESGLSSTGYTVVSADIEFRAVHPIELPPTESAKIEKFYEILQEDEQVRNIFDNVAESE
ncbi:unnamed protein product [Caenorhabditis angaria]|uniref:Transcriptional regulatory protein n=1 Tax=Caenorhabditis angaria TaxID=860376 RepID=A0A9P1N1N0_9PELO|nr:unnamed protein product [Caenorhabditis angaria]